MKGKDNWLEIIPKRKQGSNLGRSVQGNPKETNADAMEKDGNTKDQGFHNEEAVIKGSSMEPIKESKGARHSSWDELPSNMDNIPLEDYFDREGVIGKLNTL